MPPFALVILLNPPSLNEGPDHSFQSTLRDAARRRFAGSALFEGNLYARILWFHRRRTIKDVDNIIKNILDALEGVVFVNDRAITQCVACKINTQESVEIDYSNAPEDVAVELASLLLTEPEHVLYVEVGQASTRVVFGPIDGGVE